MCASINQQAVNFKGRTLPALPKHGQTQNAAVAANRRDKWERGIYSAAAVGCQGSGGMNSALPKNPRCALRHPNRPNATLHPPDPCVTLCRIMATMKRFLPLLLLPLLLVGCVTTAITNLTPSRLPRKDNGQYPFGVEWSSRKQSLIKDSIKAYVVIGLDQYLMQRTPLLTNRWETLVPIPADKDSVIYRYKFDYEYQGFAARQRDSKLSKVYQLF